MAAMTTGCDGSRKSYRDGGREGYRDGGLDHCPAMTTGMVAGPRGLPGWRPYGKPNLTKLLKRHDDFRTRYDCSQVVARTTSSQVVARTTSKCRQYDKSS